MEDKYLIQSPEDLEFQHGVAHVVWCYWEGAPMHGNRLLSFELLKQHIEVPLVLITPANLSNFLKPEHPLPSVFSQLSVVHRSDYIRAYLLHYYGGGWHDIKATRVSFKSCWSGFSDPELWMIGKPESPNGAAKVRDDSGRFMPDHFMDLIAVPAWIGRPKTPLSSEILYGIEDFISLHKQSLLKSPSSNPRDKFVPAKNPFHAILIRIKHRWAGRNPRYPLPWTVFGNYFHPAVLRYKAHISRDLPFDEKKNAGVYHRG